MSDSQVSLNDIIRQSVEDYQRYMSDQVRPWADLYKKEHELVLTVYNVASNYIAQQDAEIKELKDQLAQLQKGEVITDPAAINSAFERDHDADAVDMAS